MSIVVQQMEMVREEWKGEGKRVLGGCLSSRWELSKVALLFAFDVCASVRLSLCVCVCVCLKLFIEVNLRGKLLYIK